MRAKLRTDKEAPMCKQSNTATLEPLLTTPSTDIDEPTRRKPRTEIVAPMLLKSRTDTDAPNRAMPNTETEEAKRTKLLNANEDPRCK
jgi:hypothetical protein